MERMTKYFTELENESSVTQGCKREQPEGDCSVVSVSFECPLSTPENSSAHTGGGCAHCQGSGVCVHGRSDYNGEFVHMNFLFLGASAKRGKHCGTPACAVSLLITVVLQGLFIHTHPVHGMLR